jgi:hypothetical protein
VLLKTFGNRGPVHKPSAQTRTIFIQFLTPKTERKCMGETLCRSLRYHNHVFFLYTNLVFSKIIIEGQKPSGNNSTFCWSDNEGSFSTDMYGGIFHSFSVRYNSSNDFSSDTNCGSPRITWSTNADHSLRKTNLDRRSAFSLMLNFLRSRGSSGSIVSGYGLDDRAIEVRSQTEAKLLYP